MQPRPPAQVIFWLTLVICGVSLLTKAAAALPNEPIASWLGALASALFILIMVVLCRTIARHAQPRVYADIFA